MLDHLVYGTPDLEKSMATFEKTSGIAPIIGGSHPGYGTRNALVNLGDRSYLEIIGPDPDAPDPDRARPFGIDALKGAKLMTWAIRAMDPDSAISKTSAAAYETGPLIEATRAAPDGTVLKWRLTFGEPLQRGSLLPFIIDWQDTPHPSESLPSGCRLKSFEIHCPDPDEANSILSAMGTKPRAVGDTDEFLKAVIETPKGEITLS